MKRKPRCSTCRKIISCLPFTRLEASFDFGSARYGAAEWDSGKQYCSATCMLAAIEKGIQEALQDKEKA